MSCGTPVAASAVGGIPEILQPGAPAFLVHERSVDAWAFAVKALLERSLAPEEVRQYAVQFGWTEVIERQCDLYDAVVSRRPVAAHGDAT
jgi:glycosyltransferase involved in cell wall biosynthesis